jgi:hypothetical protein
LGTFISFDPMGYVDGTSLYSAYFVPNGLDPEGLADSPTSATTPVACPDKCGPNVTAEIADLLSRMEADFKRKSDGMKKAICRSLYARGSGDSAWDSQLMSKSGDNKYQKESEDAGCATGQCRLTFQYRDQCYYGGTLNYIVYGKASGLCAAAGIDVNAPAPIGPGPVTPLHIVAAVSYWKGPVTADKEGNVVLRPKDKIAPNWQQSTQMALHGFDPSLSPGPGDRPNCRTTCAHKISSPIGYFWL